MVKPLNLDLISLTSSTRDQTLSPTKTTPKINLQDISLETEYEDDDFNIRVRRGALLNHIHGFVDDNLFKLDMNLQIKDETHQKRKEFH